MKKAIQKTTALAVCALALHSAAAGANVAQLSDVPAGSWFAQAVSYCQANDLMTGSNGRFSPDEPMTRAMIASILHRAAGSPESTGGQAFSDVADGSWYSAPVRWAAASGLMDASGSGRFAPDAPLTREELATVLWRNAGSPEAPAGENYTDQHLIAASALPAVRWARAQGVLTGVGDGSFSPKSSTTRAQMAMVLMNLGLGGDITLTEVSAMDIMCQPSGIAAMGDGSLLVSDTYNKVVWKVTDGISSQYAGSDTIEDLYGQPLGGYNDAALTDSYFAEPWAIAPFLDGWAVSDAANNVVRLLRPTATQTINGHTTEPLTITDLGVGFAHPTGLAADGAGNLYVSDTHLDAVRKITPEGKVTTLVSGLSEPMGLCWHGGALYIAECGGNRVSKFENGKKTVLAGSGQAGLVDGPAAQAAFSGPQGVAVGGDGTVYISDTDNGAVRKLQNGQVSTLVSRQAGDLQAFFPKAPTGLLVQGNTLYICDPYARKLLAFPLR